MSSLQLLFFSHCSLRIGLKPPGITAAILSKSQRRNSSFLLGHDGRTTHLRTSSWLLDSEELIFSHILASLTTHGSSCTFFPWSGAGIQPQPCAKRSHRSSQSSGCRSCSPRQLCWPPLNPKHGLNPQNKGRAPRSHKSRGSHSLMSELQTWKNSWFGRKKGWNIESPAPGGHCCGKLGPDRHGDFRNAFAAGKGRTWPCF